MVVWVTEGQWCRLAVPVLRPNKLTGGIESSWRPTGETLSVTICAWGQYSRGRKTLVALEASFRSWLVGWSVGRSFFDAASQTKYKWATWGFFKKWIWMQLIVGKIMSLAWKSLPSSFEMVPYSIYTYTTDIRMVVLKTWAARSLFWCSDGAAAAGQYDSVCWRPPTNSN